MPPEYLIKRYEEQRKRQSANAKLKNKYAKYGKAMFKRSDTVKIKNAEIIFKQQMKYHKDNGGIIA